MKKLALAALAVVVLVAGVLAFVLTRGDDHDNGQAALMVAARTGAVDFFSLDYRHADDDVDRVLALATGKFKTQYAAQRKQIVDGVVKKKLVVTAAIPEDGAALEFLSARKAQVLVAVDVTTSATTGSAATPDRYRTRVELTRVGDKWLISGLNQVG